MKRLFILAWSCAALAAHTASAQDVDAGPPEEFASAPPAQARLTYHLRQTVDRGTGAYEGYSDSLVSVGNYTTEGGSVHAFYRWQYRSTEREDQGSVTRDVTFDPNTRAYTSSQTDLDDYDSHQGVLDTWLWIDPRLEPGQRVEILDDSFEVMGPAEVDVAGATRSALHLRAESTGDRHDEYGDFLTTYTDEYWYDAATGMFLREERTEYDDGTYEGATAGFVMTVTVEVVDASYAPAIGEMPDEPMVDVPAHLHQEVASDDDSFPWAPLLAVLGTLVVALLFVLVTRRSDPAQSQYYVQVVLEDDALPKDPAGLSPHLGAFLPHMIEVARKSGNTVSIATSTASGRVDGIAIDDRDAHLVAVYTKNADCAEALRRSSNRTELVSETRYPPLLSVHSVLSQTGRRDPGPYAYNLYESFDVMERRGALEPLDYDASVVVRMKPDDVAEAAALAERVYQVPCEKFLSACLAAHDVAFVARENGKIVGMALASVVGTAARLHMLVVDPDARSRGLGKELYRARLRALADLGVDRVVTEVATHDPAALEIARKFGMEKRGEMHVQSARPQRDPITVVRR